MIAVARSPFWLVLASAREDDALGGELRRAAERACGCGPRVGGPSITVQAYGIVVGPVGTPALTAVLELVARDPAVVLGVWVGRSANLGFQARRSTANARRAPTRVTVEAPPGSPEVRAALRPPVDVVRGLVDFHMTVLLARTQAQWRVLDALRRSANNRRLAAQSLGCSRQAVDQAVLRGAFDASARTATALAATLTLTAQAFAA